MSDEDAPGASSRELVGLVLVEAFGSSLTPFVPLPFVDDYLLGRVLRRIARKVLEHGGSPVDDRVPKAIVLGYTNAANPGLGTKAVTAAARFVVRKVAVVLDVKRSHDVFGESIAFALALDVAKRARAVHPATALEVGGAIFRVTSSVGSATIDVMTRATRDALRASEAQAPQGTSRFEQASAAIAREIDDVRARLDGAMRSELARIRLRE